MKLDIQYVNNSEGKTQSVQLPLTDWKKVMSKLRHYEQVLKIRSDLKDAFEEVSLLRKSKAKKESLNDFLDGL